MSRPSLPLLRLRAVPGLVRRQPRLERLRVKLDDGARTTLHVATFERELWSPRVVRFERATPLVRWCREHDVRHAVVGGFYQRPDYAPLGEVRIDGGLLPFLPFDAPWGELRACVQIVDGRVRIAPRDELTGADSTGDLLQAGPMLVRDGDRAIVEGEDREGFSAGAHQFDSDITVGRYPRAVLALAGELILAVACDGRNRRDAGMTLAELADALIALGATEALNLDGGGSTSLVHGGRLRNRPREQHGVDLLEGRPVVTAIVFDAI
jgi:Phosphodiester glycosidase